MNIVWPAGFISIIISIGCASHAIGDVGGTTPEASNVSATERVAWFEEAHFGMFLHWGLYSELADCWDALANPRDDATFLGLACAGLQLEIQ